MSDGLHVDILNMLIQVSHSERAFIEFICHYFELLGREVDIDGKAGLGAVLDAILGKTLVDRVLRVHVVDNLVT